MKIGIFLQRSPLFERFDTFFTIEIALSDCERMGTKGENDNRDEQKLQEFLKCCFLAQDKCALTQSVSSKPGNTALIRTFSPCDAAKHFIK